MKQANKPDILHLNKPKDVCLEAYFYDARKQKDQITPEIERNADDLMQRISLLIPAYIDAGHKMHETANGNSVLRGWNPEKNDLYAEGKAIGIYDPTGDLDDWLMEHPNILIMRGLWMEHPACTRGYCHLQTVPASDRAPRVGKHVFYP